MSLCGDRVRITAYYCSRKSLFGAEYHHSKLQGTRFSGAMYFIRKAVDAAD